MSGLKRKIKLRDVLHTTTLTLVCIYALQYIMYVVKKTTAEKYNLIPKIRNLFHHHRAVTLLMEFLKSVIENRLTSEQWHSLKWKSEFNLTPQTKSNLLRNIHDESMNVSSHISSNLFLKSNIIHSKAVKLRCSWKKKKEKLHQNYRTPAASALMKLKKEKHRIANELAASPLVRLEKK